MDSEPARIHPLSLPLPLSLAPRPTARRSRFPAQTWKPRFPAPGFRAVGGTCRAANVWDAPTHIPPPAGPPPRAPLLCTCASTLARPLRPRPRRTASPRPDQAGDVVIQHAARHPSVLRCRPARTLKTVWEGCDCAVLLAFGVPPVGSTSRCMELDGSTPHSKLGPHCSGDGSCSPSLAHLVGTFYPRRVVLTCCSRSVGLFW